MLSNDQIDEAIQEIQMALGTVRKNGEDMDTFMKREEAAKLRAGIAATQLLGNFLKNINDLAYEANSRLPR